jgi:hypothetical protein
VYETFIGRKEGARKRGAGHKHAVRR